MSKPSYTIAVTGLNAIDSPGPGLAVIRALREATSFDVRIIGLSYESLEPGIYMHELVDKTYQVPYPSAGQQVLMERFRYIQSHEKIDMLFVKDTAEAARHAVAHHYIAPESLDEIDQECDEDHQDPLPLEKLLSADEDSV